MNKLKLISFAILVMLTFTACAKDPYMVDISYLPKETQQKHQQLLKESQEQYNKATDPAEKSKFATEVAFNNMTLGNYREAINYYQKVLEFDAVHFPALNNLAYMHEEAGDLVKALEFEKRLYESNNTNSAVVEDTIRVLVKNNMFNDAQGVLEAFSKYNKSSGENKYTKFVSDQFAYIMEAKTKSKTK